MTIELHRPRPAALGCVIQALRSWQRDDAPIRLHPGELGWNWRSGAAELAAGLRTWSRNGTIVAVGFLDSPDVVRLTVAPAVWRKEEVARRVVADLSDPRAASFPRAALPLRFRTVLG